MTEASELHAQEIVVLVSCPLLEAEHIAEQLVADGLAACVNITTAKSVYRWQGEMVKEEEALLVLKSTRIVYDRLEARIVALHSYDIPEIICLTIENGYAPYLSWLNSALK